MGGWGPRGGSAVACGGVSQVSAGCVVPYNTGAWVSRMQSPGMWSRHQGISGLACGLGGRLRARGNRGVSKSDGNGMADARRANPTSSQRHHVARAKQRLLPTCRVASIGRAKCVCVRSLAATTGDKVDGAVQKMGWRASSLPVGDTSAKESNLTLRGWWCWSNQSRVPCPVPQSARPRVSHR